MNPASLAGSTVAIDRDAAADAIRVQVAEPLGLSLLDAAHGIVEVANATTMRALRSVSIERGVDPRAVSMVAFGGSGPVHAAALAGALGVPRVFVPPFPGIFSAIGLLLADFRHDAVRSLVVPLDKLDEEMVIAQYAGLERSVRAVMERQGIEAERIELHAEIDVQYRRHDMPLTLPLPRGAGNLAARIEEAFQAAHVAAFGYRRADPAEIVSLRLRGTARAGEERLSQLARAAAPLSTRESSAGRKAYFGARVGMVEVTVLDRAALGLQPRKGPLIVEEWDTSVVVPPGWSASCDEAGNIVLADEGRMP
jgi:N-methylhydantoinase A